MEDINNMKSKSDWQELLPELGRNKKYKEKKKSLARLKAKSEARELSSKMHSKKKLQKKNSKVAKGKKEVKRTPKTIIGHIKTGKETLKKVKARELVKNRKELERKARKMESKQRHLKERQPKLRLVTSSPSLTMEEPTEQTEQAINYYEQHTVDGREKQCEEKEAHITLEGKVVVHNGYNKLTCADEENKSVNLKNESTQKELSAIKAIDRATLERAIINRVIRGNANVALNNNNNNSNNNSVSNRTFVETSLPFPESNKENNTATNITNNHNNNNNNGHNVRSSSCNVKTDLLTPASLVENDSLLNAQIPFLDNYMATKSAEVVSQDELLHSAHVYFSKLTQQEQTLHKVAAQRLKELKRINRQGGDKDGFRYVVPRNVKEMTKQLLATRNGPLTTTPLNLENEVYNNNSEHIISEEAMMVDGDELDSKFHGDKLSYSDPHVASRHRRRRRQNTFSDFYQFQVSKAWTKNAENFLKRGRANKSLFESRKQQRSIRKL